ncbi:hypothetical protein ES705_05566 [subsurface metagenome]
MIFIAVSGQNFIPANEFCNDPNIKTILLNRSGWDLSMPVIYLGENEKLSLRFDCIGEQVEEYSYSLIACTYNWEINENPQHFYLDGFNNTPVYDKYSSFNTSKYFTHFSAEIPGEDLSFLRSGNYILRVYESRNPDSVIFTRRFCLAERFAEVSARVKKPNSQNQEIQIEIDLNDLNLINPLAEIKVVIIKNNDWNNIVPIAFKPLLHDNKLVLDIPCQVMAGGGNEFRYFDIKSIKYISDRVDSIKYISPETHFYLKPDIIKQFKPYFSSTDLNGRFYIDMPEAHDRHLESDYVYVHFTLEAPQPFGSDVYVYGALTYWKTDQNNFMIYNAERSVYEKIMLLKQGYYNYAYATKDYNNPKMNFDLTEGNHSETENDYLIFVYLKNPMSDFDRLVGFEIINSTEAER